MTIRTNVVKPRLPKLAENGKIAVFGTLSRGYQAKINFAITELFSLPPAEQTDQIRELFAIYIKADQMHRLLQDLASSTSEREAAYQEMMEAEKRFKMTPYFDKLPSRRKLARHFIKNAKLSLIPTTVTKKEYR